MAIKCFECGSELVFYGKNRISADSIGLKVLPPTQQELDTTGECECCKKKVRLYDDTDIFDQQLIRNPQIQVRQAYQGYINNYKEKPVLIRTLIRPKGTRKTNWAYFSLSPQVKEYCSVLRECNGIEDFLRLLEYGTEKYTICVGSDLMFFKFMPSMTVISEEQYNALINYEKVKVENVDTQPFHNEIFTCKGKEPLYVLAEKNPDNPDSFIFTRDDGERMSVDDCRNIKGKDNVICTICGRSDVGTELHMNPNTYQHYGYNEDSFEYGYCKHCDYEIYARLTDPEKVWKDMLDIYNRFRRENTTIPRYLECEIAHRDSGNECEFVRIKLDGTDQKEEGIFHYCNCFEDIKDLCYPHGSEKFIITGFYHFVEGNSNNINN